MNKNDAIILELKEKIKNKRKELGGIKGWHPRTNCSIEIEGKSYNLRTLNLNKLQFLLIILNSYKTSAQHLGLLDNFELQGFVISDWLFDINGLIAKNSKSQVERQLTNMEAYLNTLLTEEKQVERKLADIESKLKNL